MREIQQQIIDALRTKPLVNPNEEIEKRVNFIKEYLMINGLKVMILGISGGQDSTLAGKLAQLSATQLRGETGDPQYQFIAVRLPYGEQEDEADAQLALDFIHPDKSFAFNIKAVTDAFIPEYEATAGKQMRDFDKGNVKARMRMAAQYLLGAADNALVLGTDHAAEAVTGFFTKYGDGGADLTPLTGLTKRQGKALLKALNAPERLYLKTPTADLLDNAPGQADETELGISYDVLDDYLEGKEVSVEAAEKIEKRYMITRHKRELPITPYDAWWK